MGLDRHILAIGLIGCDCTRVGCSMYRNPLAPLLSSRANQRSPRCGWLTDRLFVVVLIQVVTDGVEDLLAVDWGANVHLLAL